MRVLGKTNNKNSKMKKAQNSVDKVYRDTVKMENNPS